MPYAADDRRLIFVPENTVATPVLGPAGTRCRRIADHWWIAHPERGLAFWGRFSMVPQAHADETTARELARRLYPWAEVRHVPLVVYDPDRKDAVA